MYRSIPLSDYGTQDFRCLKYTFQIGATVHAHHMMAAQRHEVSFLSLSVCLSFTHTKVPVCFCGYNILYQYLPVHRKHFWNMGEEEHFKIYVLFKNTTQKSLFVGFLWLLWDLRFSQHCCWGFRCSGMWCYVCRWTVSSFSSVGNEKCIQKSC